MFKSTGMFIFFFIFMQTYNYQYWLGKQTLSSIQSAWEMHPIIAGICGANEKVCACYNNTLREFKITDTSKDEKREHFDRPFYSTYNFTSIYLAA